MIYVINVPLSLLLLLLVPAKTEKKKTNADYNMSLKNVCIGMGFIVAGLFIVYFTTQIMQQFVLQKKIRIFLI